MRHKLVDSRLEILVGNSWLTFSPRQTEIVEAHDMGSLTVIRESYIEFVGSNVYAVDERLNVIWTAQLPHPSDIFANRLEPTRGGFVTSTWNGIRCFIDAQSGELTIMSVSK